MLAAPPPPSLWACPPELREAVSWLYTFQKDFPLHLPFSLRNFSVWRSSGTRKEEKSLTLTYFQSLYI